MIKLQEGELLDLLPSSLKNDTDMICLSYALKMAVGRLLVYERSAMTQNFVDNLPEKILDVLAVELRSPYYLDSMEISVKREIIKNTLIWHTKAGTASAVSEMASIVFGGGSVVEWPDFTEPPYTPGTFDIVTDAQLTDGMNGLFEVVIGRVKNERSHLRRVLIHRFASHVSFLGAAVSQQYRPPAVMDGHHAGREARQGIRAGMAASQKIRASPVWDGANTKNKRRGKRCHNHLRTQ